MLSIKTWEPDTLDVPGGTIGLEIRRLGFTESKPFNVVFQRIRIDDVMRAQRTLERATTALNERGIAVILAAIEAAGLTPPAANPDLEQSLEAHGAVLKAAGVPIPDVPADQERELLADLSHAGLEVAAANQLLYDSIDNDWALDVFTRNVRHVTGLEVDGQAVTTGAGLFAVADSRILLHVLRSVRRFSHLGETEKKASSSPSLSAPGAEANGSIAEPAVSVDSPRPATATASPAATSSSTEREALAVPV